MCFLAEFFGVQCNSVAESRSQRDDQIGTIDCSVGSDASMHTDQSQVSLVIISQDPGSHQCICGRDVRSFQQLSQLGTCLGCCDSAAEVDDRTFCRIDHSCHFLYGFLVEYRWWIERHRLGRFIVDLSCCNIFRDIDKNRTLTTAVGDPECVSHGIGQIFDLVYEECMLGDRHRNAGDADFLECITTDQTVRYVSCNGDHRNTVHKRCGDSRYKVCCSRAAGSKDDTGFPRCSGISVSSVGGTLFVSRQYVPDLIAVFIQRVV